MSNNAACRGDLVVSEWRLVMCCCLVIDAAKLLVSSRVTRHVFDPHKGGTELLFETRPETFGVAVPMPGVIAIQVCPHPTSTFLTLFSKNKNCHILFWFH